MEPPVTFGEWVQQRRKVLDLTQNELSDRAGCSVFALRKIESGERRPSKQLAGLLAQALNIPVEDQGTFIRIARGDLNPERLKQASTPPDPGTGAKPATLPISSNIPLPAVPLIGRENELNLLERLLSDPLCRLVTLTGTGGIGKTRLAIEAASRSISQYMDGTFFVPLASLSNSEFIIPHIADSLGLSFQGQTDLRTQLRNYLSGKHILIVMDNAEHRLECTSLFNEMLDYSPRLKLIVTSRERLQLQSEWVFEIQGLPVPTHDRISNPEDYSSVALFIHHARRMKLDYEISKADYVAIMHICRLLEGMPLGIELAASWAAVLKYDEISKEIERSMDFLATKLRDLPERQRSMRAVFDHSWKLLTKEECQVLARLAIFQGGFKRDAAEEIAGATLQTLMALISKSLLRRKDDGRYDLHEVIRQNALTHLTDSADNYMVHKRYSDYYLSTIIEQGSALKGSNQHNAIRGLTDDISNIRAAWAWAIQHDEFQLIGQVIRNYAWFCNLAGWLSEGIDQLELVVNALRKKDVDRDRLRILGVALALEGMLYFRIGDFRCALTLYEESLVVLRDLGEPDALSDPLLYSGVITCLNGEYERSRSLLEEGMASAQASGQRWYEAYAKFNLGYLDSTLGHYEAGHKKMMAGLAIWRDIGDPSSTALALNHLVHTLVQLSKFNEAETALNESLMLCEQGGDRWGLGTANRYMGALKIAQGDLESAQSYLQKSLDLFDGFNIGWDIVKSRIYQGDAKIAAGKYEEAKQIFLDTLPLAAVTLAPPLVLDILAGLAYIHLMSGENMPAFKLSLVIQNQSASMHTTIKRAGMIATQASEKLQPDEVKYIKNEVMNKSLGNFVEEILSLNEG